MVPRGFVVAVRIRDALATAQEREIMIMRVRYRFTSLALACVACGISAGQLQAATRFTRAPQGTSTQRSLSPRQHGLMQRVAQQPGSQIQGGNGTWAKLPPPMMDEPSATYDRAHNRVILFGGSSGYGAGNDLWALNLGPSPTWSLLATVGTRPSGRSAGGLAYDPANDRLWLFGGSDETGTTLNDVWSVPLGVEPLVWAQVSPSGTPPAARAYVSTALDSLNDRLLIFGGAQTVVAEGSPSGMLSDVWSLNLSGSPAWTPLAPSGSAPNARAASQMIWDGTSQRLVVFGGFDGASMLADLFQMTLLGSPAWSGLSASGTPPAGRAVAPAIWDPAVGRMVMFGGIGDGDVMHTDLWSLSLGGSPAWTELAPSGGPPSPRHMPVGAFDSQANALVIYGYRGVSDASVSDLAWSVSLSGSPAWTAVGGSVSPGRQDAAGIFDPIRNRLISFGGQWYPTSYFNDAWAFNLTSNWNPITASGPVPAARMGHTVVYDSVRDRMLVFGGMNGGGPRNDVHALALGTSTWGPVATTGGPPAARHWHTAVYDNLRDRMVVQGGSSGNDTWALNLATNIWSQLDIGISGPGNRTNHSAVYDALHDRLVIYGGPSDQQVWALNFSGPASWTQLTVAGTPPSAQVDVATAYDPVANAMVLFGGASSDWNTAHNASTALVLRDAPIWVPLDFGSDLPEARRRPVTGYNPASGMLYVTGGCCGNLNDTWVSTFDRATPVTASLVSANSLPNRVAVTWSVSSDASNLRIDRNDGSGWQPIAMRSPDGTGMVRFEDWDIVAGRRYGYRLNVPVAGGGITISEAWVNVPALELALAGFRPNPAVRNASIAFRLGSSSPARLEVIDIAGRTVFTREVGALGAGSHVESIGSVGTGVYVLRLTQDGHMVSTKATLMR